MPGSDDGDRGTLSDPDYCPNCGTELGDPGIYCSRCGTHCRSDAAGEAAEDADRADAGTGSGTTGPAPRGPGPGEGPGSGGSGSDDGDGGDGGESPEAFRRRVEDWLVEGWEVESDRGDSVVLVDRGYGSAGGHLAVFLLTAWFTAGIGNLVYAIYKHQSAPDKVVLRRGGRTSRRDRRLRERRGYSTGNLLAGVGLMLIGILFIASGPFDVTGLALGLFFLFAGGVVFPPLRRRLRNRHPATSFGRVRSTEERVIRDPDRPCTVCGSPIEEGVERRYSEEVALAGIPLYTSEEGDNPYCQECADDRLGGPDVTDDVTGTDALDAELAAMTDEDPAASDDAPTSDEDEAAGSAESVEEFDVSTE